MHLLSYFKSLPHSTANQGHGIVPSLHKHSLFPFKKREVSTCQSHIASHLQPFISRKIEQIRKDDLLQYAPASCYSSAPSSTDLYLGTPGLLSLPSEMSCISAKSMPRIQEVLTHSIGSTPAISAHPPCREQDQPRPPAEINLALQPNEKSF